MELSVIRVDPISTLSTSPVDVSAPSSASPPPSSPETSSNSSPTSPTQLDRRSKAHILKSLKESIPHAMALKELEFLRKEASSHRRTVRRLSKDLYQVLSIYALLQGVLFAAVAQTTVLSCAEWWGPVFMAVAVTAGTLLDKLWDVNQRKDEVEKSAQRQRDASDSIDKMRWEGSNLHLDDMDRAPAQAQHTPASGYDHCFFSVRALLVLGFLVGFSVLITASCVQMLCSGCKCQAGTP